MTALNIGLGSMTIFEPSYEKFEHTICIVGQLKCKKSDINRQLKLNKSDNEIEKFNFAFN